MKKAPLLFLGISALAMCGFAFQKPVLQTFSFVPLPEARAAAATQTFTGEISDGQCAAKSSHDAVMKKASVNSAVNCVRGCAKSHGAVLVDGNDIYKLDDVNKALDFAAQKVKISGTLDKANNTIHIVGIEAGK